MRDVARLLGALVLLSLSMPGCLAGPGETDVDEPEEAAGTTEAPFLVGWPGPHGRGLCLVREPNGVRWGACRPQGAGGGGGGGGGAVIFAIFFSYGSPAPVG